MSKVKTLLPEDYSPQGPEFDPDIVNDLSPVDLAVWDILKAVKVLQANLVPPKDAPLLRKLSGQLSNVADVAERPF